MSTPKTILTSRQLSPMPAQSLIKPAMIRAFGSILFTLMVWAWMLTRSEGTFHDQGGMAITFVYFPATLVVWLYCSLTALVSLLRSNKKESEAEGNPVRRLCWKVVGLIALGLLLSIGTLGIA